jgi:hypothetical protein
LHAVRSALLVTRTLALLVGLVAAGPGCARRSEKPPEPAAGPQLVVRTLAAPDAHYNPDEYVQLTATRVHVSRPQRSAFWQAVGSYFVDRSSSAILTVGVQVNGKSVGVLPLATIKTAAAGGVTREIKENEPLTSPLRLQQSDQVSLQASLVEASDETETKLVNAAKTIGGAASLPVSTVVPGGGAAFDVAGQFWAFARAVGKPQDVTLTRDGGLDRHLWELDRIELVPAADLARFDANRDQLLDPKHLLADDDPTFVVIRVDRRSRLYDPALVLVDPSPMRGKVAFFVDEMREAGDAQKMKSCRRLRTFLRTEVGVNPPDETAVVIAVLHESGYDPDRSQASRDGCLTDEDLRSARAAGFRWGSCDSTASCRLARTFAEAWFARQSLMPLTIAPLAVYDRVFGAGSREDLDPGAFLELVELQPSWEPPAAESDGTASFRGTVERGGQTRPARVRVSLGYDAHGAPRVARVELCAPESTAECAPAPAP